MSHEYQVAIPHCYKSLASRNKQLYIRYIKAYVNALYPNLKPVRIEKYYVICEANM